MGETFRITLNIPEVVKSLSTLIYEQVPYATAVALTRTAQDAQAAVKASLPQKFTVRNSWVARGIRIERAEKRDWPHAKATVLDKDEFMALQEEGGTKAARRRSMAVPLDIRQPKTVTLLQGKWPKALLKRKGYFIQKLPNGKTGLFQRAGSGPITGRAVKLLYVFETSARIKPRFGFEKTITEAVEKRWEANFAEALEKATATAR